MAFEGDLEGFPHSLTFNIPLPTPRLASAIQTALEVDRELSHQVKRNIAVSQEDSSVLVINYRAATARVLRVSANGCMESLSLALRVCEELDEAVLERSYGKTSAT